MKIRPCFSLHVHNLISMLYSFVRQHFDHRHPNRWRSILNHAWLLHLLLLLPSMQQKQSGARGNKTTSTTCGPTRTKCWTQTGQKIQARCHPNEIRSLAKHGWWWGWWSSCLGIFFDEPLFSISLVYRI